MRKAPAPAEGLPRGRQAQVAYLAADGFKDGEIADRLGISSHTVGTYFKRAMEEVKAKSRTELVAILLRRRIRRLEAALLEKDARIEILESELGLLREREASCARE